MADLMEGTFDLGYSSPFFMTQSNDRILVGIGGEYDEIRGLNLKDLQMSQFDQFSISQKEYDDFKRTVVNKNGKWIIENAHGEMVEVPGRWTTTSGGRRKVRKSRKTKSRKSRSRKSRR